MVDPEKTLIESGYSPAWPTNLRVLNTAKPLTVEEMVVPVNWAEVLAETWIW
jgi:hypothetical protein